MTTSDAKPMNVAKLGKSLRSHADSTPNWTWDATARAGYLAINESEVAKTVEIASGLLVDFNSAGEVVGVEVL